MDVFFRSVALVLVSVILVLVLNSGKNGIGVLLSVAVCCMVAFSALRVLEQARAFAASLQNVIALDSDLLQTLFKVVGISITAEIAGLICADSGNAAMGKALGFLASAVILWLSLPLLTALLELIEGILGNV